MGTFSCTYSRHSMFSKYFLLTLCVSFTAINADKNVENELTPSRKPKLFFVSTSVSVSTLSTLTFCYSTDMVTATCTSKRRRSILDALFTESDQADIIKPDEPQDDLDSSIDEFDEEGVERDGKFLMYWLTTTSTTTSTSYTATSTLIISSCTPSTGFPLCG